MRGRYSYEMVIGGFEVDVVVVVVVVVLIMVVLAVIVRLVGRFSCIHGVIINSGT